MTEKQIKRRKDSVFGMHFDFHANDRMHDIGAASDPVALEEMLRRVKPDYVQVDTKGHPGLSSYPTKVGTRADLAEGIDRLRIWRTVTEKLGIALYAHHSSLWDAQMLKEHPEWGVVNEDGSRSGDFISLFSPYAKERLIPQLIELAVDYRLDGVWMDGGCWCAAVDYSPAAEAAYRKATGKPLPKHDDPDYPNFVAFEQAAYDAFVCEYCDAVHAVAPDFQMCESWLYTTHHPNRKNFPLDFASGDLGACGNDRLLARMFQKTGLPWDIMPWYRSVDGTFNVFDMDATPWIAKQPAQLMQEAALSLSQGGGFEYCDAMYDRMTSPHAPVFAELSAFCRARAPYCLGVKAVPQAAVYFAEAGPLDTVAKRGNSDILYTTGPLYNGANSLLNLMLDAQLPTGIIFDDEAYAAYGLIAVPNYTSLKDCEKQKLLDYAKNGGRLLLAGPDTLKLFAEDLGITVTPENGRCAFAETGERPTELLGTYCRAEGSFRVLANLYGNQRMEGEAIPAAFSMDYGKGRICGIVSALNEYMRLPLAATRAFLADILRGFWKNPGVTVSGSDFVEVSLMEKDGARYVNLVNTVSLFDGCFGTKQSGLISQLPPLYHLQVEIAADTAPAEVWLEPEHQKADFTYKDGKISLSVEKLDIHTVVVIR